MIHINIDSHRKTLSSLQELKEKMLSEREHQLAIVESMEKGWEGLTARTFCTMQRQMLENGLYETTYQQTKGMCLNVNAV